MKSLASHEDAVNIVDGAWQKNTPYIQPKDLSENSVNMDLFPAAQLLFDFNVISYNPKPQQMIAKTF